MITYKEVFQLAKDKGSKLRFYAPGLIEVDTENEDNLLLELTLIQKWLRDEHKLYVIVDFPNTLHFCRWSIEGESFYTDSRYAKNKDFATYEQALLEGIYQALKLI